MDRYPTTGKKKGKREKWVGGEMCHRKDYATYKVDSSTYYYRYNVQRIEIFINSIIIILLIFIYFNVQRF